MSFINTIMRGIRGRYDGIPTLGPLSRQDARLWRQVESLEDIGELTARWLEGDIETHPGYYGRPDEETSELIPVLADLNRAGYVTTGSQPGEGPVRGVWDEPELRWWWQRAAVDGFARAEVADRIQETSAESGLTVVRHERAGWRTDWDDAVWVTATGPEEAPEPPENARMHTSFGAHLSRKVIATECLDATSAEFVYGTPQVTVVDPQWGRNDLLWPALVRELARERDDLELAEPVRDERERIEIDHREAPETRDTAVADLDHAVDTEEPESGEGGAAREGWFAVRRALHELSKAFGQLDIYDNVIKGSGTERDDPGWRQAIIDRIDELVAEAPLSAVDEYIGAHEDEWPATTRQDYIDAWEDIKAEWAEDEVQERLDGIDPLTSEDVTLEATGDAAADPIDESDGSSLGATTVTPELELDDAELVAEPEPTGPELALDTSEVALEVTDPELAADEQQLDEPADETELAEPELDADILQGGAEVVAEQELPELTVVEPELAVVEPGVTVSEPGLDTVSYEQGPAPTSWWGSKTQQVKGWTGDKYQLTKDWIKELRSGRHKQCHGAWEEPGTWGGAKECTIQVAKNTFGMSLSDVKDTYGHNFVNEILYRNDVQNQSFDDIAKFIDRTQLQGRAVELERE
jgi:hypothetical protein